MSLTIATEAPSFDLPGVDGRNHSLDDYADAPILAVVWSCNHCPYVIAWEGRMKALQEEYGDRGFRLVAINSNDAENYPADSFEAMKQRAQEQEFNFDYLHDADQSVARSTARSARPRSSSSTATAARLPRRDRRQPRGGRCHRALRARRDRGAARRPGSAGQRDPPPVGCSVKCEGGKRTYPPRRMSSSAPPRVEIVPAARSSAMRFSSHRPISGPGGRPSSSPRRSGLGRNGGDSAIAPLQPQPRPPANACRPPPPSAASRGGSGVDGFAARGQAELGAKQLPGIPPQLVRDRQLPEPVAEDRDEPHVGRRVAEGSSRSSEPPSGASSPSSSRRSKPTGPGGRAPRGCAPAGFVTSPAPPARAARSPHRAGSRARPRGGLRAAV